MSSVDNKPARTDVIDDPLKVLEVLKDAILRRSVDPAQAVTAVHQVLKNFEEQNRLFLIAAANAQMPRILRLMTFINEAEEELFKPARVREASTRDLTRMYALAQTMVLNAVTDIKQVADMRLEVLRATGGSPEDATKKLFGSLEKSNEMSDVPGLTATSRDRVRKIVSGLMEAIEKDDTVRSSPDEQDEESDVIAVSDDSDDSE